MIREPAARRCAEQLLSGSICRIPLTPAILDMAARVIMTFVVGDERAQENEKILGEDRKE